MNPAGTLFPASSYIGIVALLFANSFGLPLPEEIILVLAGAAAYQGKMDVYAVLAMASFAIVVADFLVYWLGRRWGRPLLRRRFVRFLLRPGRVEKFRKRYSGHFLRGIFTVRFISGLRAPAYFTAGTLRVPAHEFILTDALATLIYVPVFTMLGFVFSPKVGTIVDFLKRADRAIAVTVIIAAVVAATYVGYRFGMRREKGRRSEEEAP